MTREEELIGEVIAARGLAQMLAIMLVKDGIVPREKLEGYVVALAKMWKSRADQTNPAIDLAAARLGEFMKEFADIMDMDEGNQASH